MQKIPLIISFCIAAILTIYIAIFETEPEAKTISFSKYILPFEPEELIEIEILNKENEKIIFDRPNGIWRISKPITCRANQEFIQTIASQLPRLPKSNCVQPSEQRPLADYGLQTPLITVTVTLRELNKSTEKKRFLQFGYLTGSKNEVFVKANDDEHVYLLPAIIYRGLSNNLNKFRDSKILDQIPDKITKLSFDTPEEKWAIEKSASIWYLVEPTTWKANIESVVEVLKNLSSLEIKDFVENDLSKKENYGLNQPVVKISYTDVNSNSTTYYIGSSRAGSTYIQSTNENFIYSVDTQELLECIPFAQSLKDFAMFTTKSPELVQVDYTQGKDLFNFQKNVKQQWMINATTYPLDQQIVNSFLEQVTLISPEYFVDGDLNQAEFGLVSQDTIKLNIINIKNEKESLKIGSVAKGWVIPSKIKHFNTLEKAKKYAKTYNVKEQEIVELKNQYYAIYNNFSQIFTIPDDIVNRLKDPLIKFEPLEFPEISINSIFTIERIINGKKEHYQRFGSNLNWEMITPEKLKLNDKEIALFIFTLCFFKVEEWVKSNFTENEFKDYGLDLPLIQIEATFNNISEAIKTGQYKYLISKKINGNYYGCVYISVNGQEYKLVPKLFIVPEKTMTERLLKKLY